MITIVMMTVLFLTIGKMTAPIASLIAPLTVPLTASVISYVLEHAQVFSRLRTPRQASRAAAVSKGTVRWCWSGGRLRWIPT